MDPESKKLLEETYKLAQDNNNMLHKVRNIQKWAAFWQTLKVLVVVVITLWSLYYIQPYLQKVADVYNSISSFGQKPSSTPAPSNTSNSNFFQDIWKKF